MRHGSLFSGIGGFDLAAQWMGWENVFQVEWDKKCQKRLKQNFHRVELYGNIDDFNGTRYAGRIDVLSGGPPCQPTSSAGKRKGEKDDRWKWPETIRVLGEVRPRFAVFENPDDLLSLDNGRAFERICVQMENLGYTVETYGIPAVCVGAWHERDRIWVIAYTNNPGSQDRWLKSAGSLSGECQTGYTDTNHLSTITKPSRFPRWQDCPPESFVCRDVHGIPNRVDRIKGLGNSVVPQVVLEIFKAIEQVSHL